MNEITAIQITDLTVLPAPVKFPVSHGVTQIPTGDIMSPQFCGNHPFLKISVIAPGETTMSHGNRRNFQKWTVLPRDTMCPAGICVTPWDTGNFTTSSTVYNLIGKRHDANHLILLYFSYSNVDFTTFSRSINSTLIHNIFKVYIKTAPSFS